MESTFTNFAGKVYAITGVAGMGLSIAKLLVQYGASVSLADISQKSLDEAFSALGSDSSRIFATQVDVGDSTQVDKWISDTVAKFGGLDGAANFAGAIGKHHGTREFVDQDDSQWDLIIRVNLTGMMYCLKAELKAMKELMKKDGKEKSVSRSIVNAASIQGIRGFPKHTAYSTSKHGVIGLTRSVAQEIAKDNIRLNCVAPGNIQTPLLDQSLEIQGGSVDMSAHAIKRVGTADEVAQLTLFLLSDASQYVTGAVYSIDGGWN